MAVTGPAGGGQSYDPKRFWDAKALHSGGDPMRAVCYDDPDSNRTIDRVQRRAIGWALDALPRGLATGAASLLDFGCGSGRWVDFFTKRGFRYSGVDISTEMLRLAQEGQPQAAFAPVEGGRIPHPEGSFDLVCSIAAIHHNPYPQQDELLSEIARVVRPGGFAIFFEGLGRRTEKTGILYPRPVADWTAAMRERGFRLEKHCGMRYWVLRPMAARLAGRLPGLGGRGRIEWKTGPEKPGWQRLVDRLDAILAPLLGPALPEGWHQRGVLVFHKAGSEAPAG